MPSRSHRPCRSAICWRPTAGRWRPTSLTLPRQPALQAAACLLGERDEDERLLQMALNLLHKV